MRRLIVLVILQSAIAPASAQDLDPIRDFDIRTIEELGREIFRLDRYAAIATDILLSQDLDLDDFPLRGWIVTDTPTGPLVTFVGAYEDSLRAIFDVRPDSTGDARFETDPLPDIPDGGELVMMYMTHVVSRTPVETHVYLSLLHDMGFAIVTGEDEFWIAQGGSVQKIEP